MTKIIQVSTSKQEDIKYWGIKEMAELETLILNNQNPLASIKSLQSSSPLSKLKKVQLHSAFSKEQEDLRYLKLLIHLEELTISLEYVACWVLVEICKGCNNLIKLDVYSIGYTPSLFSFLFLILCFSLFLLLLFLFLPFSSFLPFFKLVILFV